MGVKQQLRDRVEPHEAEAFALLQAAWRAERAAEHSDHIDEWAERQKEAIARYRELYQVVVKAQRCKCTGLCPGGAACASITEDGRCPCCGGPAKVCKPRHQKGYSCG